MPARQFRNVGELLDELTDDEPLKSAVRQGVASRQVISQLVSLRASEDLSQADIARELGCTQSRISKLESGVDAELRLGDIEGYARALGRRPQITLLKAGATLMDQVKVHAFQILDCLEKIATLSNGDPEMERSAVHAHLETLANMARLIGTSTASIPSAKAELARISGDEFTAIAPDGKGSNGPTRAAGSDRALVET